MDNIMEQILLSELLSEIEPSREMLPNTKLNPNAMEFVPSHLKQPGKLSDGDESSGENSKMSGAGDVAVNNSLVAVAVAVAVADAASQSQPGPTDMKSEATSTTTLLQQELESEATAVADDDEALFNLQREMISLLSQLGGKSKQLLSIKVSLAPNGHSINVLFKGRCENENEDEEERPTPLCEAAALHMNVASRTMLKNKPCNVLVAQFLRRMSDAINEKIKWNLDMVCPQCTKRSYTEAEIERQIEGIKAFEKFFMLNADTGARCSDIVDHSAFKELCEKLGLPTTSETQSESSLAEGNAANGQPSLETDVEYAGDDESQSNCDVESICDNQSLCDVSEPTLAESELELDTASPATSEYLAGDEVYRFEGHQMHINQLSDELEEEESPQLLLNGAETQRRRLEVPNPTPAISMTATNIAAVATFTTGRTVISQMPKSKTGRQAGGGATSKKSGATAHKETRGQNTAQRLRASAVSRVKAVAESLPISVTGNRTKTYQRVQVPRNAIAAAYQSERAGAASGGSRSVRSTSHRLEPRHVAPVSKTPASSYSSSSKPAKGNATHRSGAKTSSGSSGAHKLAPRSTAASVMRQTEVKRRLSLFRGQGPDPDLLYNDYLFK